MASERSRGGARRPRSFATQRVWRSAEETSMSLRSALGRGRFTAPVHEQRSCTFLAEARRAAIALLAASAFALLSAVEPANAAVTVRVWGGSGTGDGQFTTAQFLATNQA